MALSPLAACETLDGGEGGPVPPGASCAPADRDVDYSRVRANPDALALAVKEARLGHTDVRRKAGVQSLNPGRDHILIFTRGSFLPGRYSLQATRDRAGDWTVERVSEGRDDRGGRLPPEQPSVQRGALTGEKAAALSRLLGDRCLYSEPTYYGRTVPTWPTGEATCADGADSLIEIKADGRTHTSFHACHSFGRPAQVEAMLWEALRPAS